MTILSEGARAVLQQTRDSLHTEIARIDSLLALDGSPLSLEEFNMVKANRLIDAIKAYRNRVGCSLMEAKNAVEAARRP